MSAPACGGGGDDELFPRDDELNQLRNLRPVKSRRGQDATNALLTADAGRKAAAEALGEQFFFEEGWGPCAVSCATCHPAPTFADPGKVKSQGCSATTRNTPSLYNVQFQRTFFWDGRSDSLWSQGTGPFLNPLEINATPESVKAKVLEAYGDSYAALFGEAAEAQEPSRVLANVGKALQTYLWRERFIPNESRFDRELGEFLTLAQTAIDSGVPADQQKVEALPIFEGMRVFTRKAQCIVCHRNPELSDDTATQFHNIGLSQLGDAAFERGYPSGFAHWENDIYRADESYSDDPSGAGRQRSTLMRAALSQELVEGAFKTPSLRNVSKTPPYMHNGSIGTLEEVVEFYNRGGDPAGFYPGTRAITIKPLDLTDGEKAALLDLLHALDIDNPAG